MLSIQGNKALSLIFDKFREEYVRDNPGCNMNDVERAFLSIITYELGYAASEDSPFMQKVTTLIEEIA